MRIDKHSCIDRAKYLLSVPSDVNIYYVALELRMCIEALTYEKLKSFSAVVPASVLATWQPPQAVKALLEFEPQSDQSFRVEYAKEDVPGQSPSEEAFKHLGEHKSLSLKWLKKHYNKLGSYLHAPNPAANRDTQDVEVICQYLNEVVADLAEPISSTITGGMLRNTINFNCEVCEKLVISNQEAVEKSKKAICLNPQCGAEYKLNKMPDGEFRVELDSTEFECIKCKKPVLVEIRKIDVGLSFICGSCKTKHEIVAHKWGYQCKNI